MWTIHTNARCEPFSLRNLFKKRFCRNALRTASKCWHFRNRNPRPSLFMWQVPFIHVPFGVCHNICLFSFTVHSPWCLLPNVMCVDAKKGECLCTRVRPQPQRVFKFNFCTIRRTNYPSHFVICLSAAVRSTKFVQFSFVCHRQLNWFFECTTNHDRKLQQRAATQFTFKLRQ